MNINHQSKDQTNHVIPKDEYPVIVSPQPDFKDPSNPNNLTYQNFERYNKTFKRTYTNAEPLKSFSDKENCREINFIEENYKERLVRDMQYLHLRGLPTGNYHMQKLTLKIEDIFVQPDFFVNQERNVKTTLSQVISGSKHVVVTGEPGMGKTTLIKYLTLMNCQKQNEVESSIPFIIPLIEIAGLIRDGFSYEDFIDYLKNRTSFKDNLDYIEAEQFKNFLSQYKVIVFFDGLDDISESDQIRVADEIQRFIQAYPRASIWVTCRQNRYDAILRLGKLFKKYHLAPFSENKTLEFIRKWYQISVKNSESLDEEFIQSLNLAVKKNSKISSLSRNPLLLTMMVLLHQFEGNIPHDRVNLYEKSIELLLKTWQLQKSTSTGKMPIESKRRFDYNEELNILAAASFDILKRNLDEKNNTWHHLEDKVLKNSLLSVRCDKKRRSDKQAIKDIRVLLRHFCEDTGFINKKRDRILSFTFPPFGDYLCAYQMAKNTNKSLDELIDEMLDNAGKPSWEEPILLCINISAKALGPVFIDTFFEKALDRANKNNNTEISLLLGLAVRDNIDFAQKDVEYIIGNLINIWYETREERVFQIIEEISLFSGRGAKILIPYLQAANKGKHKKKSKKIKRLFDDLCLKNNHFTI